MSLSPDSIISSDSITVEFQEPILVPFKYALLPFTTSINKNISKKLFIKVDNLDCRIIVPPNATPYFALDSQESLTNCIRKIEHNANIQLINLAREGTAPPPIQCAYSSGIVHLIKPSIVGPSTFIKPAWNIQGFSKVKETKYLQNIKLTIEISNIILNDYGNYPAALFIRVSKLDQGIIDYKYFYIFIFAIILLFIYFYFSQTDNTYN